MINFNKNSVWNLRPINVNEVRNELYGLLLNDEVILSAFKTIRDQLVFTNKRIVAIDVQGITGSKRSFSSLPYSKVQFLPSKHQALWKWSRIPSCTLNSQAAFLPHLSLKAM